MSLKKGLGIPVGPSDFERLAKYADKFIPRLLDIGWVPAFELKTDNILEEEQWVKDVVRLKRRYGGFLTWHANDRFSSAIGRGLSVSEGIRYLSRARWLIERHGCKIVMHFGTLNWPSFDKNTPEPILPLLHKDRFIAPIGCSGYWTLLRAQRQFTEVMAQHFGAKTFKGENTHICLGGVGPYNAMQTGTALFVAWLSKTTGIQTCLDIEHFWELEWFLRRPGIQDRYPIVVKQNLAPIQEAVIELTGMVIKKGEIPYAADNFPSTLKDVIAAMKPKTFHIGGTKESLNRLGVLNAHLPITTAKAARKVGLPSVIEYISGNGGSMIVEANGADFWLKAGYPCSPRIKNDEEAKWKTLETVFSLIEK